MPLPLLRVALPLVIGALLDASPASAQRGDVLPVGARVRVVRFDPPRAVVIGVLARADSAALTITAADGARATVVPRSEVARLEQSRGQRSVGTAFWRGAGRGALVGVGVSAALLGVAALSEARDPCSDCFVNAPLAAAIVGVPFTALTTVVGGVVGLRFRERWTPLPRP